MTPSGLGWTRTRPSSDAQLGRWIRTRRLALATVLTGMAVPACRQPAPTKSLPPRPPVLEIVMGEPHELAFSLPSAIPAGRVVFRIRNAGRVEHDLVLTPLPDSLPPLHEQLSGPTRVAARPYAGVPVRAPGATGTFAVDLAAGQRYGVICFVRDANGESHASHGMSAEFRAGP